MRLRFALVSVVLLSVASLPAFAQWQWGHPRPPRSGACFYQDDHFRGNFFCMNPDDRWPSLPRGFNDRISSIRVFGRARLRVFNDSNFRGESLLVDRNIDNLRRVPLRADPRKHWNDRISSIAVFTTRDQWGPR